MDVGVDTCLYEHERYTPYSFEEILGIMKIKRGNLKQENY